MKIEPLTVIRLSFLHFLQAKPSVQNLLEVLEKGFRKSGFHGYPVKSHVEMYPS